MDFLDAKTACFRRSGNRCCCCGLVVSIFACQPSNYLVKGADHNVHDERHHEKAEASLDEATVIFRHCAICGSLINCRICGIVRLSVLDDDKEVLKIVASEQTNGWQKNVLHQRRDNLFEQREVNTCTCRYLTIRRNITLWNDAPIINATANCTMFPRSFRNDKNPPQHSLALTSDRLMSGVSSLGATSALSISSDICTIK